MKDLWAIIKYEARQSLYIPIVIVLLLILAAGLAFIQLHTIEYKDLRAQKAIFQAVEKCKVDMYSSYRQYASFGFRVLFLPAPISILFSNSAVVQDMTAYIDSGERLNIYKPLKNKNVFTITKYLFADFSGIFFFFVGLIAVFYGFPAFRSREYLKNLTSIAGKKNLFRNILLARAILLALYNLLFLASAVLLISLNGVSIGIDRYLVLFFLEMCCVTTFFLVLGAAFGSLKSKTWGFGGITTSWLLLLFILPFLIALIVSVNAASIKPETQLEIEKLKLMMDFEKRFKDETGIVPLNKTITDIQKELVIGYYKNEFQKMQALEDQVKAQMQNCKKMHYWLSSFFPTTFYQSLTNELSSKGYETLEEFYNTVKQIKEAFFKEYMKQLFLLPQPTKVEPFLKGDENIIVGKPALPGYLLLGFCFNLLWIAALAMVAYPCFKKRLAEVPELEEDENIKKPTLISIHTNNTNFFDVDDDSLTATLYNLMSSDANRFQQKDPIYNFQLNRKPWDTTAGKQDFLYLCHPGEFPKIVKTGDYINLQMDLMQVSKPKRAEIIENHSLAPIMNKRIRRLTRRELGRVFLSILEMKPFAFYLFNDVCRKMPLDFAMALKDRMNELYSADGTVIFIYSGIQILKPQGRKKLGSGDTSNWESTVQSLADLAAFAKRQEAEEGEEA